MPKYNIYKIHKSRENELIEKFESVGLECISTKEIDGFTFRFFLSTNPEDVPIWWMELYGDFLLQTLREQITNKIYFAALLISNSEMSYVISMGKTHFYLKEFCDLDFGVDLAERIIDEKSISMKNSRLFGGQRIKAINSYQANTELEFESGESILFLKGRSVNKELWGKTLNCGNSVLFNIKTQPANLPSFLRQIEAELKNPPKFKLPRSVEIKENDKIQELDEKLIVALKNRYYTSVGVMDASLSGVDFIFLNKNRFIIIS